MRFYQKSYNLIRNYKFRVKKKLIATRLAYNYDLRNTIVLTGAPRSGTTWLGEILNTIPNSAIIFEPLHIRQVPEAKSAGFDWVTYLDPSNDYPQAFDFIHKVLSGSIITNWTSRELSGLTFIECLKINTLIVKFVRAHMILDWMVKHFNIRRPILIIRHPCAVVASQIRREWKYRITQDTFKFEPIFKIYPHLWDNIKRLKTIEQFLAAKWCIDYYFPLSQTKNYELVAYERLITDGPIEIERIFTKLGVTIPVDAFKRIKIPSITTYDGNPWDSKNPLKRWYHFLDKRQINQILDVVKRFKMDFYTDEFEPDYPRLYQENAALVHNE